MKKIVSFASAMALGLALAACGGADEPADETAMPADDMATTAPATSAGLTELPVGTAEMTMSDGTASTVTISEDGAYEMQPADGLATAGIASIENGRLCFDPSGDEGATCWTASAPDATGSYTVTSEDGNTATITPQASTEPAAM